MKESAFWGSIKGPLSRGAHLTRIENDAGNGVSDVSACSDSVEAWLELKVFKGNQLHFRNGQRIWGRERGSVGGNVYVLARKDDRIMLYDAVLVFEAPFTSNGDGRSFHVNLKDLPAPIVELEKPFSWLILSREIFRNRQ